MMLLRAWTALLLVAVALSPLAAADQDVSAGPARIQTQNASWGDGDCDPTADGGQSRYAKAGVALTQHEEIAIVATQNCNTYSWSDGFSTSREEWHSGSVQIGRFSDGNPGPVIQVYYMDHRYDWGGWEGHSCSSGLYLSGPALHLGCFPDRGQWPMLPTLP